MRRGHVSDRVSLALGTNSEEILRNLALAPGSDRIHKLKESMISSIFKAKHPSLILIANDSYSKAKLEESLG